MKERRIRTILRCMALDHRIGGLLLLDAAPGLLPAMARGLAGALSGRGAPPATIVAGSWLSEDDLWLRASFADGVFEVVPGLLVERGAPPILLVPDLASAGPAVTRAAVTLLGAETATAERHGWSAAWQPRARWLAAVDRRAAAGLSPHLLDRFPVRLDAAGIEPDQVPVEAVPPGGGMPPLTEDALDEVLGIVGSGMRLSLALARTARALGCLAGAGRTGRDQVRQAAELLGLISRVAGEEADRAVESAESHGGGGPPAREAPADPVHPPVRAADPPTAVDAPATAVSLYPEASPEALPEMASLRNPWAGVARRHQLRGPKTGTERTRSKFDLAVVPTLLEAAKHRRERTAADSLIVLPEDWRRYRRGWMPARLLALVLDHTCRRGGNWTAALAPYLQWAYAERAAVCVVSLGHLDAAHELRAERYRAASVRDPWVLRSLHQPPGHATPLAAGIDLAVQDLLRHFRRSRTHSDRAWLVVVTDGRGNVPLHASAEGRVVGPVHRQGIDDALTAAAAVRSIAGVRSVVITPDATPYPMLPFDLADALGGVVVSTAAAVP